MSTEHSVPSEDKHVDFSMQVNVHYSEELMRSAVIHYWRRIVGIRGILIILIACVVLAFSSLLNLPALLVGALGAVLFTYVCIVITIYLTFQKGALERLQKMGTPQSLFELSETKLRVVSDMGDSNLAWRTIEAVWQFPDVWLVFLARNSFITLPINDFPLETRAFFERQVRESGGKVT